MAKNFILRQPGNPQTPPIPQEETALQTAQRVGTATGLKALKGAEGIASLIGKAGEFATRNIPAPKTFGNQPFPQNQNVGAKFPSQHIEEKYGITPEYLKPQNTLEDFLQRLGASAGPAALTGGLAGLGTTVLGSAAAAGAGKLGAGETLQDIIQLGTELGTGLAAPYITKGIPGEIAKRIQNIPTIGTARHKAYQLAKGNVSPQLKLAVTPIETGIGNVLDSLKQEVDTSLATKVKDAIRVIEDNFTDKKINPWSAKELRSSLYKIGNKIDKDQRIKYFDPLTEGINKFFDLHAATTPEFYKNLKYGDKLSTLKHMELYLPELIGELNLKKIPGAGPIVEGVLSKIAGQGEKFARGIANNSGARKYWFDTFKAFAKNDPYTGVKNLQNLGRHIPGYSKPERETEKKFVLRQPR